MGKYILNETPSGWKTITYTNSRDIRLHSAYDPAKEAGRAVSSFTIGRANFIIVCGLGLGYHIVALKNKFPDCRIIAVEKDREIVDILSKTYPGHLTGISIINSQNDIPGVFERIDLSPFKGVKAYYHRPSYLLETGFYDDVFTDINRFLSSKLADLLTRFEFEEKWIENIFRNIHKTFYNIPVINLFGRFKHCPGIIVSAGPSLKKNVDLLNRLRNRAVIIAVDTALKVLLKHNVMPHIVMTIDAQKHSLKHFLGIKKYPVLLADLVSYPRITEFYNEKIIFSTTSKYYSNPDGSSRREPTPVMDWIEDFIRPIGDIQSGGSVATSVFDLLLNLGCSSIILVGQDLAYTGREIHCTGTHHNEEWLTRISRFQNLENINQRVTRKRKIKYVLSYGGNGTVISDYVFDLYKSWFEDSVLKVKIPVINATGGGARINNTIEKSLETLIDELKPLKNTPDEILSRCLSPAKSDPDRLYEAIKKSAGEISRIIDMAGRELKETDNARRDKILKMIDDQELSKLYNPFLRKTSSYLSRHQDLDPVKASSIYLNDIASASKKLLKMLEITEKNLESLNKT